MKSLLMQKDKVKQLFVFFFFQQKNGKIKTQFNLIINYNNVIDLINNNKKLIIMQTTTFT